MRLKTNITVILIIFLTVSCKNDRLIDSKSLLIDIDNLQINKLKYELQTDSLGNVLDTISKIITKKNEDNEKVYEENIIYKDNGFLNIKSYYKAGTLVYSKTESSELGIISIFETNLDRNKIINASTISYFDNEVLDTIKMDYDYFYNGNNSLNKLVISIQDDTIKKTKIIISYNKLEKPYLEIEEINNKVQFKTVYEYNKHNIISKKIIKDYNSNSIIEFIYDENGSLLTEEVLVKGINSFETIRKVEYISNEGEITNKIILNFKTDDKHFYLYK